MRRHDKEITDDALIRTVLQKATICHLGLVDKGQPYVVAMNFGVEGSALYFHSAPAGRKIEILRANPQVCFQMECRTELVTGPNACNYSMRYLSVVGYGTATLMEADTDKRRALDIIMRKYADRERWEYGEGSLMGMVIIRVDISEMTGKQSRMNIKENAADSGERR